MLPSPPPLHSLCKCNRRITQDNALQSRDMMPPFCEYRGVQTNLTWCNQQNELCCVIYSSHWLEGIWSPGVCCLNVQVVRDSCSQVVCVRGYCVLNQTLPFIISTSFKVISSGDFAKKNAKALCFIIFLIPLIRWKTLRLPVGVTILRLGTIDTSNIECLIINLTLVHTARLNNIN